MARSGPLGGARAGGNEAEDAVEDAGRDGGVDLCGSGVGGAVWMSGAGARHEPTKAETQRGRRTEREIMARNWRQVPRCDGLELSHLARTGLVSHERMGHADHSWLKRVVRRRHFTLAMVG